MAPEIDSLFDVRINFYLGAYQQCINHAQNVSLKSEEEKLIKDTFLYRSYIALNKWSIPISEIDPTSAPLALKAVRRFAEYYSNLNKKNNQANQTIVEEVSREAEKNQDDNDDTRLLINSLIFTHEDRIEDALRVLSKGTSLECRAATIQCLLKLNRVDLAIKEVKKMQEFDEDSTITQLALAWVGMSYGKEKLKDSFYIYQEMIDKYGATPYLLVSQAACQIQQQKYEEAVKLLQDAQQRDVNNPDVLVGLVVANQFLQKPFEHTNRHIGQLIEDFPGHVWTREYLSKEAEFDNLA